MFKSMYGLEARPDSPSSPTRLALNDSPGMPACLVCEQNIPGDDETLAVHVNAHFENDSEPDVTYLGQSASTGGHGQGTSPPPVCFVCGLSLEGFDESATNVHVNACLDGGAGGAPAPEIGPEDFENYEDTDLYDSDRENDWANEARDGKHGVRKYGGRRIKNMKWDREVFANKRGPGDKSAKGDRWWDPQRGSLVAGAVPPNISPGLIPVLRDMLETSASSGWTRSAVLARDGVHIKGAFGFDSTWGCGYRNALMAIAAMVSLYPTVFENRGDPGVRSIQHWIEEAWDSGFDAAGRTQLKGKVSGTQKWIGTTDLYAMFSAMGIPCTLYDFNKPSQRQTDESTHKILERWIRNYFDEDDTGSLGESNAFDELMRPKVRIGTKLPVILQHAGHSRTVVGYELAGNDMNLLLFDPGKSVPKDVREAGLASLRRAREERSTSSTTSGPRTARVSIHEGDSAADPLSDEEVRKGGWVRKKKAKMGTQDPPMSSLSVFRTNLGRWKHNQFQVLVFPGTPLLSQAERNSRKVVDSVDVQI